MPPEYGNFFVASTGASAALLGLLFVSISIAPERVFGNNATSSRRSLAVSAFTALANAFFISLSALIPHIGFGVAVVVIGAISLSQSISLVLSARSWKREGRLLRGVVLFVAGVSVYGGEIFTGLGLASTSDPTGFLYVINELLVAVFAIGLFRAWELLGAPYGRGVFTGTIEWMENRIEKPAAETQESKKP